MSKNLHILLVLIAGLSLAACGGSSTATSPTTTTTTTTTTAANTTQTFAGSLNKNGAVTMPFQANAAGTVTVTLKSIDPDATIAIGFAIGNWNATTSACAWAVANDTALVGATLTGTTGGATSLCVRAYDVGKLGDTPLNFSFDISHP